METVITLVNERGCFPNGGGCCCCFRPLALLTSSCVGMNGLKGLKGASEVHRSIKVWSTARLLLMFRTVCS